MPSRSPGAPNRLGVACRQLVVYRGFSGKPGQQVWEGLCTGSTDTCPPGLFLAPLWLTPVTQASLGPL